MSIATEIQDLNTNLTAAKNAVTTKGGTVGDTGLAGLATEIASIPSGGDDDPGNYGIVWYYENVVANFDRIDTQGCSVEVVDEGAFVKTMSNDASAFSGFNLFITYRPSMGGWDCRGIFDEPVTTEELEEKLGLSITNFDTTASARIMMNGNLAVDKTQPPAKLKLQSLEDYERLADSSNPIVPLALVYKFMFGRAVTTVPDGFLKGVSSLEYLDTTYADGIVTIGNNCIVSERGTGIRNDIEFKNATSIGNSCFREGICRGAMSFPNVVSVGNMCFGGATSQPSLPKVETIGSFFMSGCRIQGKLSLNQMPLLRSIGADAFSQGYIDEFFLDVRTQMQNLTSIGAAFCEGMYRLDAVTLSDGVELLNIDNSSFTVYYQSVSYIAGTKLTWYVDSSKKQQFINAHPNITSGGNDRRKWRS